MSKKEALHAHSQPPFCHATVEEYAAFLQTYTPDAKQRTRFLRYRNHFVKCYPNLQEWFSAPLPERIGWSSHEGERQYTYEVSYQARLYLMFLALRNYAPLDWDWLIAVREINATKMLNSPAFGSNFAMLIEQAKALGYKPEYARAALKWSVHRLFLHLGTANIEDVRAPDIDEFFEALDRFRSHSDVALFFGSDEHYRKLFHHHLQPCFQVLRTVLYHYHQAQVAPPRRRGHHPPPRAVLKPQMEAVAQAYLRSRQLTDEPHTVANIATPLHQFIEWLAHTHPDLEAFSEVTRDMVMEYAEALNTTESSITHRPFAAGTKQKKLSALAQFFQDTAKWQWEDVPGKSLLQSRDLPKLPERIPRYIPQKELDLLMPAIRELACPYRRAALLIARWSGARREEIQRLAVNCLDTYPDGTPRLHIPAGKTKRERLIPLNQEAAEAIRLLQEHQKGKRGLPDRQTGVETHYLFLYHGKLLSVEYLFANPLQEVCETVGLMTPDDKASITAHRFRHTVGTQLAQRGARFRTIQKILGHQSAQMTAIYLGITDEDVRNDYQAVLGPDATIAGPGAALVRSGTLAQSEVAWLKENYFKNRT